MRRLAVPGACLGLLSCLALFFRVDALTVRLPREAGSFREGDRVRLMSGPRGTQVTRVAE